MTSEQILEKIKKAFEKSIEDFSCGTVMETPEGLILFDTGWMDKDTLLEELKQEFKNDF